MTVLTNQVNELSLGNRERVFSGSRAQTSRKIDQKTKDLTAFKKTLEGKFNDNRANRLPLAIRTELWDETKK